MKCKQTKDIDKFYRDISSIDGHANMCSQCVNNRNKKNSHTLIGLIKSMYRSQQSSTIARNFTPIGYSLEEFIEWMVFNPKLKDLFISWKNSGYKKMLKPSIDRIDDYGGYSFENIQLMSWQENMDKAFIDIKSGKNSKTLRAIVVFKDGHYLDEYKSIAITVRKLNIKRGGIMNVLNGNIKQFNGFVFYYKENAPTDLLNHKSYTKNRYGVIGINKKLGKIIEFNSIKEAQDKMHIFNISEASSGSRKSAGGYIWEYKKDGGISLNS